MIQKEEIETKAKEFEIHISNVERDYVFGWILFGLFTISELKDTIFLKGGNALRKGYFENTRFSLDIDLGIPTDIQQERLIEEVNKICDFIQEKAGITFVKEDNRIEEKFTATEAPIPDLRVYEVRVYFKDFYGKSDHIKIKISMDITRFDKALLPIQKVKLIHPYSDAAEIACEIRCAKLEEIIATKLKCLLQRQHAPDLFDYVYSVKLLGGDLDKEEVVKTFIQKTIFSRNPHVVKEILCKTSFDYFKRLWSKTIVCAKKIIFEVDEAIDFFIADMEALFNIFPDNGFRQFAFFGADLRAPIMEAGRNQTLLKVRYNGADRMVEPYSLKYLQRKDGAQREYFYVYNISGGSSPPGVRCFVAENVQSIENTEEKFDPRFQIELSKAGEKPENPYLFDPNRPTKAPRRRAGTISRISTRSRRPSYGPKYIYQCSSCGKKFYRKTQNSSIKPHKSKSGFTCYGYGVYAGMKY
ncbi:MAG: nucleotidyl transferase AbiEii/AbiGii toxin family protein [Candidatus Levybacteria bacterium]|nr:nucleotidyl transferase AbiEii/AbiGii toxin family protein [Candidatus Levybacteria bacterium]MDZ4228424.1 nucleotidyl transferase AbiEii/AbiGii toxin family protein [Candidatus Levybacteria bacterium]